MMPNSNSASCKDDSCLRAERQLILARERQRVSKEAGSVEGGRFAAPAGRDCARMRKRLHLQPAATLRAQYGAKGEQRERFSIVTTGTRSVCLRVRRAPVHTSTAPADWSTAGV